MEYISYALITLVIVAACYLLMRPHASPEDLRNAQSKSAKLEEEETRRLEILNAKRVLQREISKVPTPWGWPGHHGPAASDAQLRSEIQEVRGVSESLYHFVDRLFSEKRTVDSEEYLLRRDASIRAMFEDRYGRASSMKEMAYRKVKSPLLRDPRSPHDQMDNFPSGKVDKIVAGISKQPATVTRLKSQVAFKKAVGDLKGMRTPWGW